MEKGRTPCESRTVCRDLAPDGGEVSGAGRLDWDLPLAASGGEPGHGTAPGGSLSGKKETAVSGALIPDAYSRSWWTPILPHDGQ